MQFSKQIQYNPNLCMPFSGGTSYIEEFPHSGRLYSDRIASGETIARFISLIWRESARIAPEYIVVNFFPEHVVVTSLDRSCLECKRTVRHLHEQICILL